VRRQLWAAPVAVLRCCTPERHSDHLLANYWQRGQRESLTQVTRSMTVMQGRLRALRLLYFRAVRGDRPVPIFWSVARGSRVAEGLCAADGGCNGLVRLAMSGLVAAL